MLAGHAKTDPTPTPPGAGAAPRAGWLALALAAVAVLYAGGSAYRTVVDTDIGWQMAAGRYLVEHGSVPRHDVFSYTARGAEWIYPPFSGLLLYGVWRAGGYEALTWLGVAAAAGILALLLLPRRAGFVTAALAVIAAPKIAFHSLPRANLFTAVLFAVLLLILWRHHHSEPGAAPALGRKASGRALWLLPVLMAAWVNLNLGFAAGLALLAAYAGMELLEMLRPAARGAARARLRVAVPWLAAAALATLANPWGPRIYAALGRQARVMEEHRETITEWSAVRFTPETFDQLLAWRDPRSATWWLLIAAAVAIVAALRRRRFGPAALLAAIAAVSLTAVRLQGLFAVTAVVVAGSLLDDEIRRPARTPATFRPRSLARIAPAAGLAAFVALLLLLAGVRVADLVTNRYYLTSGEIAVFGAGLTRWHPAGAAGFLTRQRPPGRLYNDYNFGGYLVFTLPQYPVFIDGRAIPFSTDLVRQSRLLAELPPDSSEWQQTAARWNINAVVFSVAHQAGSPARLRLLCGSRSWLLAHLDDSAAVFLRNRPENAALALDCSRVEPHPPPGLNRAELYNFHLNSANVLYHLGRGAEALKLLESAHAVFAADPRLYLLKGAISQSAGRHAGAEAHFREALRRGGGSQAELAIGVALAAQGRFPEAERGIERAARRSDSSEAWRQLGEVRLAAGRPRDALKAFDRAEAAAGEPGSGGRLGAGFGAQLAMGRAHAWFRLGDIEQALSHQQRAAALTPDEPARWRELAELYDALGRAGEAGEARARAAALDAAR